MALLCPKSYEMTRDGSACCQKKEDEQGEIHCIPIIQFSRSERTVPLPPMHRTLPERLEWAAPVSYVAVRYRY